MARRTRRQFNEIGNEIIMQDKQHERSIAEVENLLEHYDDGGYGVKLPHDLSDVHVNFEDHAGLPDAISDLAEHCATLARNFVASRRGELRGVDGKCHFVLGNPGSGKSYLVERTLVKNSKLNREINGTTKRHWAFVTLSEEASRKTMAEDIIRALGYDLDLDHGYTVAALWTLVHDLLAHKRIGILVLDETQHGATTKKRAREFRDVLKLLVSNKRWRVNVICIGLPRLTDLLAFDDGDDKDPAQIWRRSAPFAMKKLGTVGDRILLMALTKEYAELADLCCSDDLQLERHDTTFIDGLLSIGFGGAGEIIPIMQSAVLGAARQHAGDNAFDELALVDFENAYRKAECCADKFNPFSAKFGGKTATVKQAVADVRRRAEEGRK